MAFRIASGRFRPDSSLVTCRARINPSSCMGGWQTLTIRTHTSGHGSARPVLLKRPEVRSPVDRPAPTRRSLASREGQQRLKFVRISGPKRRDITAAKIRRLDQTVPPPGERRQTERHDEDFRRQPCVTTVPVWEGVYPHQPVMKPHGGLIRFEALVGDPVSCGFDAAVIRTTGCISPNRGAPAGRMRHRHLLPDGAALVELLGPCSPQRFPGSGFRECAPSPTDGGISTGSA